MTLIIGGGDKPVEPSLFIPGKKQKPLEPNESYLERGMRMMIDSKFQRSDLFQIISEKRIFNDNNKQIWDQNKGNLAEVVEVRFNGEWVCDVMANMTPEFAYIQILNGLQELKKKLERRTS